jgi:hypothetical protein
MRLVPITLALLVWGCGAGPPPPDPEATAETKLDKSAVTWQRVGSWSGRGDGQTTTFLMERHEGRLNWEARRGGGEGDSRLTVNVHSADSGRILDVPLDDVQPGAGSVKMVQEPRVFYLSIETGDLEWELSADERIEGTQPRSLAR